MSDWFTVCLYILNYYNTEVWHVCCAHSGNFKMSSNALSVIVWKITLNSLVYDYANQLISLVSIRTKPICSPIYVDIRNHLGAQGNP